MKNKIAITIFHLSTCFIPATSLASKNHSLSCQYNSGEWINVQLTDNGPAFTYKWADGPQMSYVWKGSLADRWNITDTLGGRWNFYDYRYGKGVVLTNLDNGNTIKCK